MLDAPCNHETKNSPPVVAVATPSSHQPSGNLGASFGAYPARAGAERHATTSKRRHISCVAIASSCKVASRDLSTEQFERAH